MALLTPGAVGDSNGFGLISFRGITPTQNNVEIDGADDNQAYSDAGVQRAKGLIHQQDTRLKNERGGDSHPLLHPTGKLRREFLLVTFQADLLYPLVGPVQTLERATPRSFKPKATFSITLRCGSIEYFWSTSPRSVDLHKELKSNVAQGATLYTDKWVGYRGLKAEFNHSTVDHMAKEYVNGDCHTNGIESFWALFNVAITAFITT